MGILEKLRPAPRWKHADPAVRASAVFELGADAGDVLRTLVREDGDARVRRTAVSRLVDIDVLRETAKSDPDDEVRQEAVRCLAGLAAESESPDEALRSVQALVELGRLKELAAVARDGTHEAIRLSVVDRLDDQKTLAAIARHASDGSTRLRALSRVQAADELLNIAIKSEHTDTAVAALDRIDVAEGLGAVAQRGRNKVAARRARTRLRAIETPAVPAVADAMPAEDRARARELLSRLEGLVAMSDPDAATSALADAKLAWAELQADVVVDDDLLQAAAAATDAATEAIGERLRELSAERERQEAVARDQAARTAICDEIEQLEGTQALDRIAVLKVQWDTLPPMPAEFAPSLTRRFQDACRAFDNRERRRAMAAMAAERIEPLTTELEQLVGSVQPLEDVVARWRGLRRDAELLREHRPGEPGVAERLEQAMSALEAKEHELETVRARVEQDNLKRLMQLVRHVEGLAAAEAVSLKAGDRAMRDIKAALDERAPLPSKKDRQEVQARLEAARTVLAPKVQELHDADEWQRWANLQVQEQLCVAMEELRAVEDLELVSRRMRELQARWKQVSLAPRAQGEAMWRRFKTVQDEVYARVSAFLASQNEERVGNLARKQALCDRVAALVDSTDWVQTAAEIQRLQAEWKTVGPVSRGHEKAVWERFRTACDQFFTRRHEDLKRRKEEWAVNLTKKESLCERAEALAQSTDWDAAAAQVKQLQAEWKTVGPVRKSKSEAIWQRFRTACDGFFERYKNRDRVELQSKTVPREEVITGLEALAPSENVTAGEAPAQLLDQVQQARQKWQQAAELPRALQQELTARYQAALGRIVGAWPAAFEGTDLDPQVARKRMEKLLARVEGLLTAGASPSEPRALSPTELLAQRWRERLASNTMGRSSDAADDARRREAEQVVKDAQSQWMRLGPVPAEVAGPLNERFQLACRRFFDSRRKAS